MFWKKILVLAFLVLSFAKTSWAFDPFIHIASKYRDTFVEDCSEIPVLRVKLAYYDGFLENTSEMRRQLFEGLGQSPDRFLMDALIQNYSSDILNKRLPVLNQLVSLEESCSNK